MKQIALKFTGVRPMLMHNDRMANPMDFYAKEKKKYTVKRGNKTDADLEKIDEISWYGALYLKDDAAETADAITIPGRVVEAVCVEGAKATKNGKTAKGAIFCYDEDVQLNFPEKKKKLSALYKDDDYNFRISVKVGMQKVMSNRPHFKDWEVIATVNYNEDVVDSGDVLRWFKDGESRAGFGDWRPKFGAYKVEEIR